MEKPPVTLRPIAAFYLSVFLITFMIAALIMHLALVSEVKFFMSFNTDLLIVSIVLFTFLIIPKRNKLWIGEKTLPILKGILSLYGKRGSYEKLEEQVYEQRRLRLEGDKRIKSNPLVHAIVVGVVVLSVIGFVFLMYYSATGNF
jgi:hypothetical protein